MHGLLLHVTVILGHVFIATSDEVKNVTDLLSSTKAKGMFKDLDDKLVPRLASVERKSEKNTGGQPARSRLRPSCSWGLFLYEAH